VKPDPRVLKLNVDATFYVEDGAGAVGAVVRDFEGRMLAAQCMMLPHIPSAAMFEAYAMKEGLTLVERLGCSRVIAESDSIETVEACNGEQRWWNDSAAIFADCIDIVTNIGDISFRCCPRDANQVAHELAKYSYAHKISCNWDDDPPSFLLDRLLNDVKIT
jgi:ribonuclease HI